MLLKLFLFLLTLLITVGCSFKSSVQVDQKDISGTSSNKLNLVIDARELEDKSLKRRIDVFDVEVEYGSAFIANIKNNLSPYFNTITIAYYEDEITDYDLLLKVNYNYSKICEGQKENKSCDYKIDTRNNLISKDTSSVIIVRDKFNSDVSAFSESMAILTIGTLGLLAPITIPASNQATGDKFKNELSEVNKKIAEKIAEKIIVSPLYISLLNGTELYETNTNKIFTETNTIPQFLINSEKHTTDNTKWLFIVGIEDYEYTAPVAYSKNSAVEFKSVIKKRLGIPEKNIRILINQGATSAKINYNLKDMLRRVKNGDTIYFYYSGHGIPVPSKNNEPYMLAQDMNPAYIDDDRFKLQNIYMQLSDSKASKVVAFVDSCFSGGTDNQALIKGVAATRLKPKKVTFNNSKMVVISAGSETQYSNKYDEKSNRLFSYYVMRGLINNNTDTQRLYDYVKSNVQDKSYEMGASYEQVPVYDGNIKLKL